ncbi:MAG: protein-glutamate O-methyltransferase CheR [Acidobacteriota bacterium]|nr:protein-glutamate O-methyltransferase CheR [Acidobacteriota bacterium]
MSVVFEEAAPALSDRELNAVVQLVYQRSGITLHDGKRALITARLQKRLKAGGFRSFAAYLRFVEQDASGQELVQLLDAIATNHTSFFREPQHFDFLREQIVPEWLGRPDRGPIELWSAACSTGEEPYTILMTLLDALPAADAGRVRLLASDLSTKALATARAGVYRLDRVQDLPPAILRRHFERGLGEQEGLARVRPALRERVTFEQRNLLEIGAMGRPFDVIFCRNVMIYFDRAVQQRVVAALERHLAPGGYLFISHSEGLNGVTHGLQWVAPAVYRRRLT